MLSGCANFSVNDNRVGCTVIDGKARYGYIQGVSGKAKGVYTYIGKSLKGKVKVTCALDKQEIIYGGN